MAGRRDNDDFFNKRSYKGGRHRNNVQQNLPPMEEGFGAGSILQTQRYIKSAEKYNPAQMYDAVKAVVADGESKSKKQQKTKFVNLYGEQGQERLVMKLPGRNECNCQGLMHGLINNCLKCGRIICEQEGSGSCFFCSNVVCSREEQRILDQGGRKAEELQTKLVLLPLPKPTAKKQDQPLETDTKTTKEDDEKSVGSTKSGKGDKSAGSKSGKGKGKSPSSSGSTPSSAKDFTKGLEKALAEKDRLLDYQRNSARRTMVYDDEADYFDTSANPWLSKDEKEKLNQRQQELRASQNVPRSQRKITLDLGGRQVIEEKPLIDLYDPNDAVIQEVYFKGGAPSQVEAVDFQITDFDDVHRPGFFRPTYGLDEQQSGVQSSTVGSKTDTSRLQDEAARGLVDRGRCLSMHQPYASLLVRGIKKHEGRSWYTSHRGPLWIASTAKQTVMEEIQQVEQFYRLFYHNFLPTEFPSQYLSGCLLGCVEVVDCLPQEQYRELYPSGESESPYVWICDKPRELSTHFPIRGQHKIYNLDPTIHQAAKKMIELREKGQKQ